MTVGINNKRNDPNDAKRAKTGHISTFQQSFYITKGKENSNDCRILRDTRVEEYLLGYGPECKM